MQDVALTTDSRPETGAAVNHPAHYGGDTPFEAIKVIHDWGLGFDVGNALKYILRAGKKGSAHGDLEKARWYIGNALNSTHQEWFVPARLFLDADDVCRAHAVRGSLYASVHALSRAASSRQPSTQDGQLRKARQHLEDEISLYAAEVAIVPLAGALALS